MARFYRQKLTNQEVMRKYRDDRGPQPVQGPAEKPLTGIHSRRRRSNFRPQPLPPAEPAAEPNPDGPGPN